MNADLAGLRLMALDFITLDIRQSEFQHHAFSTSIDKSTVAPLKIFPSCSVLSLIQLKSCLG